MNINDFIKEYYRHNPNGHYFDGSTLKFFGECRSKMRVFKRTVEVVDVQGEKHTCYCVSKWSSKHPCGARRTYAYFDTSTFEDVIV